MIQVGTCGAVTGGTGGSPGVLFVGVHAQPEHKFRSFESYKDAQTPRDHRVRQDKAGSTEQLYMLFIKKNCLKGEFKCLNQTKVRTFV
jgi:hypothetical protein